MNKNDLPPMIIKDKKIGVWGLGVSGHATLSYLTAHTTHLSVLDQNPPLAEDLAFFQQHNIRFFTDPQERKEFFALNEIIIPSPGIDTRALTKEQHAKLIAELDLFCLAWPKKLVAITGTLGKTSTTTLLSELLTIAGLTVSTGGNIGRGMLDLLNESASSTLAVIELSSFQLEEARHCSPDLAIWTNLFPNHLDRHGTMEAYTEAKKQVLLHQKNEQCALIHLNLITTIRSDERLAQRHFTWCSKTRPSSEEQTLLHPHERVFYLTPTGDIAEWQKKNNQEIIRLKKELIPPLSFRENWVLLTAGCHLLDLEIESLVRYSQRFSLPHNRLEFVRTVKGVDYYNDSKSTLMQATLAAVNELNGRPLTLLLGGLSKGVDRALYLKELSGIAHIICFGGERETLALGCKAHNKQVSACATLEDAVALAAATASPNSCVLLSPGGASFDLFKNYEARGARFVELVQALAPA